MNEVEGMFLVGLSDLGKRTRLSDSVRRKTLAGVFTQILWREGSDFKIGGKMSRKIIRKPGKKISSKCKPVVKGNCPLNLR